MKKVVKLIEDMANYGTLHRKGIVKIIKLKYKEYGT